MIIFVQAVLYNNKWSNCLLKKMYMFCLVSLVYQSPGLIKNLVLVVPNRKKHKYPYFFPQISAKMLGVVKNRTQHLKLSWNFPHVTNAYNNVFCVNNLLKFCQTTHVTQTLAAVWRLMSKLCHDVSSHERP